MTTEAKKKNFHNRLHETFPFRPEPVFFRAKGEEDPILYTGVELELESTRKPKRDGYDFIDENTLPNDLLDIIDDFNKDKFWFYKSDGSLSNGAECVTHPFTFRYLQEQFPVEELFARLQGKVAPWDTAGYFNPGIHIHMSRKAFTNDHLFKFIKFHYANAAYCKHVGGRDSTMGSFNIAKAIGTVAPPLVDQYLKLVTHGGGRFNDRYICVNLYHPGTAELRYFRTTTKPARFRGLVEWAYALYEYTKATEAPTAKGMTEFLQQHERDYSNALGVVLDRADCKPETKAEYKHLAGALIEPASPRSWEARG